MLPSQVFHRPDRDSAGAVCLAEGRRAASAPERRGDRGAVIVHVAVAMAGLLAFSALTIDLGTVWVVRAQVQNAADAAALAGAVSLAYVSPDPDHAAAAAQAIAQQHSVWGETLGAASVSTTAGPCPAGAPATSGECMSVAVTRGTATGTPLPVFFSRMFGAVSPEVRASASAKVLLGNAATCPRPLAIPDRWIDSYDETPPEDSVWRDDDLYARYDNTGALNIFPPATPDSYSPPSDSGPGTGLTVSDFRGVRITRDVIEANEGRPLRAGQMLALDFLNEGSFEQRILAYRDNVAACNGEPLSIGATVATLSPHRDSYTNVPLRNLIDSDRGAYWDDVSQSIRGSAFPVSPRLITIAVIDPDAFSSQNRPPGTDPQVVVRNLVGLFVEDSFGDDYATVRGVLVPMAGSYDPSAPTITDQATFLRTVALVR
jgi:Flp pilus assembly protein TadG